MSRHSVLYAATGALRAPWRLLIFGLLSFAATLLLQPLALAATGASPTADVTTLRVPQTLALWLATLLAFLFAHIVCVRYIEKRSWEMVGLHRAAARPRVLIEGFVLGALAIGVPTVLLLAPGWLDVHPTHAGSWWGTAALLALVLAPAALAEELLVRGYPFAVLREVWGWRAALVVTSIAFGLLHLANVDMVGDPAIGVQAIVLVTLAGILLGAILLATGSLYAAWFAHFAWNWVMAALFHAPVSGLPMATPDYRVVDAGPDWATGGPWGPEAGVGAALGMAAALVYLYRARRRRGESTTGE